MAKLYRTVPDRETGDFITEAVWDRSIRDNINNLIVPPMCISSFSGTPGDTVYLLQGVSLQVPDLAFSDITTAYHVDNDGFRSTVAPAAGGPTIRTEGVYVVDIWYDPPSIGGFWDGQVLLQDGQSVGRMSATYIEAASFQTLFKLVPDDVVQLWIAYYTDTVGLDFPFYAYIQSRRFCVVRVGND